MSDKISQNERVSYSFGFKMNLGNYESTDMHFSFSRDVKEGETEAVAMVKTMEFVDAVAKRKMKSMREQNVDK